MKKILIIVLFFFPINLFGQEYDSLMLLINNTLNRKVDISKAENINYIKSLDKKILLKSFDFLSNYDTMPILYNNIDILNDILSVYTSHTDKDVRKTALNLHLDIYRLPRSSASMHIKSTDIDKKLKNKILDILSDKPYTEKEINVLTTLKRNYFKSVYTDEHIIKFERIDTTNRMMSSIKDSLINIDMQQFINNLQSPSCNKDMLSGICSWLYIYEAIPYIEKYIDESSDSRYIKCNLARLHCSKYEDEIIKQNLENKYLNYRELMYINTRKSIEAMIQGLRIEGRCHGFATVFNKQGEMVTIEGDGTFYKITNLRDFFDHYHYSLKIPSNFNRKISDYKPDDSTFTECEEVAKWLEENIDNLHLNPELRF